MTGTPVANHDDLRARARRLGFFGLLGRFEEFGEQPWLPGLLACEEAERDKRSLLRRRRHAKLGDFKPLADFDWTWPTKIDRDGIEDLFRLDFIAEAANVVLIGGNGLGKTTIADNLADKALLAGHTVRRVTVSQMLNDLAAQESSHTLTRRLNRYCRPDLLVLDEVGYLALGSRHGDLLFDVVSRRHQKRSIVLTTNRVFGEWNEVFPNSSCVTALVDRLVHKAEIFKVEGESYRKKEAEERARRKADERKAQRRRGKGPP